MKTVVSTTKFHLHPEDNTQLNALCGQMNEHLRFLERELQIQIFNRGFSFTLKGGQAAINEGEQLIKQLYAETEQNRDLSAHDIQLTLQDQLKLPFDRKAHDPNLIYTNRKAIKPRNAHQREYIERIHAHDINFAIGPAGTGKTYLAVVCAVEALQQGKVRRIILVRPAVEAGEHLGFLPGDLTEKIDPYLRPLYDALYETLGFDTVAHHLENGIIEIAPLAFMRGRTLNEAFIILDESQNTTVEQMKMFLTRIGFGSKSVICGDVTQSDLAKHITSGLRHCQKILENIEGISFTYFTSADVVRHPLVQRIVNAYEQYESRE